MSCGYSFKCTLVECPEIIKVWAGLLPNTDYAWLITDKHDNEYYEYFTTDANGNFEIDVTTLTASDTFPQGLFNHHAGYFTLQIREIPDYYSEPVTLKFCEDQYDSITLDFIKSNKDSSYQHIKCEL